LVVEATEEDGLVMSLVENIARRQHRAIDLLHDIEGMKRRGYSEEQIAAKTDLTVEYVRGVIRLIEGGEDRLLRAVESGAIPVSVAIQIPFTANSTVIDLLQIGCKQLSLPTVGTPPNQRTPNYDSQSTSMRDRQDPGPTRFMMAFVKSCVEERPPRSGVEMWSSWTTA
jgi:hypothetical protein